MFFYTLVFIFSVEIVYDRVHAAQNQNKIDARNQAPIVGTSDNDIDLNLIEDARWGFQGYGLPDETSSQSSKSTDTSASNHQEGLRRSSTNIFFQNTGNGVKRTVASAGSPSRDKRGPRLSAPLTKVENILNKAEKGGIIRYFLEEQDAGNLRATSQNQAKRAGYLFPKYMKKEYKKQSSEVDQAKQDIEERKRLWKKYLDDFVKWDTTMLSGVNARIQTRNAEEFSVQAPVVRTLNEQKAMDEQYEKDICFRMYRSFMYQKQKRANTLLDEAKLTWQYAKKEDTGFSIQSYPFHIGSFWRHSPYARPSKKTFHRRRAENVYEPFVIRAPNALQKLATYFLDRHVFHKSDWSVAELFPDVIRSKGYTQGREYLLGILQSKGCQKVINGDIPFGYINWPPTQKSAITLPPRELDIIRISDLSPPNPTIDADFMKNEWKYMAIHFGAKSPEYIYRTVNGDSFNQYRRKWGNNQAEWGKNHNIYLLTSKFLQTELLAQYNRLWFEALHVEAVNDQDMVLSKVAPDFKSLLRLEAQKQGDKIRKLEVEFNKMKETKQRKIKAYFKLWIENIAHSNANQRLPGVSPVDAHYPRTTNAKKEDHIAFLMKKGQEGERMKMQVRIRPSLDGWNDYSPTWESKSPAAEVKAPELPILRFPSVDSTGTSILVFDEDGDRWQLENPFQHEVDMLEKKDLNRFLNLIPSENVWCNIAPSKCKDTILADLRASYSRDCGESIFSTGTFSKYQLNM